jgi:hypothetical protein
MQKNDILDALTDVLDACSAMHEKRNVINWQLSCQ